MAESSTVATRKKTKKQTKTPTKQRRSGSQKTSAPRRATNAKKPALRAAKEPTKSKIVSLAGTRLDRAENTLQKNLALKRVFESLRALIEKSSKAEANVQYEIGAKVFDVMSDETKYGTKGVQVLADLLGYDDGVLYEYAKVAKVWPTKKEVIEILSRPTARKTTLYFSHLVALAKVTETKRRNALLDRAIQEGWTVRQLEQAIEPRSSETEKNEPAEVRSFKVAMKAWETQGASISEKTRKLIANAKKSPNRKVFGLMAESVKAQRALAKQISECADELDKAHEELSSSSGEKTFGTSRKSEAG